MQQLIRAAPALLLVLASAARAQEDEKPERPDLSKSGRYAAAKPMIDFVELSLNFYDQGDHGGNPNQQEEVRILQPMLLLSTSLSEKWSASLLLQSDLIMAGSDSGSGASGRAAGAGAAAPAGEEGEEGEGGDAGDGGDFLNLTEIQYGGTLGVNHKWSPQTQLRAGVSFSHEDNYRSLGSYLRWDYETAEKNDAFAVRLAALFDQVELEYYDGTDGGEDDKRTISPGFAWTHVLGERTIGSLHYDLTFQQGYLGTPAQSVLVGTTEVREELPDSRLRHGFHGRARHLLLDSLAAEPTAGYYFDDWGARAYSLELNLYWEAVPDSLVVRPGYRYYSQTAVDFFLPEGATSVPPYRTQDSDLGEFQTHVYGIKLTFLKSSVLGDEFEIAVDVADRSDGIEWITVSVGFSWR